MKRQSEVNTLENLAGEPGFEPGLHGPEPCVLPLDVSPATPQKAARIGQQIQSLLSNPLHCLEQLCSQQYKSLDQKYQLIKCQPRHLWPAGSLFPPIIVQLYNILADNGKETIPLAVPPTIPLSADENDTIMAPLRCRDLLRRWHHAN